MEAATTAHGAGTETAFYQRMSDDLDILEHYVAVVNEPHRYSCIGNFIIPRICELEKHRGKSIGFEMLLRDYQSLHKRFLAIEKTLF